MKSLWIIFFTFLIGLTSVIADLRGTIELTDDKISSASAFKSSWESGALARTEERYSKESNYIAQDFIPIVLLADTQIFKPNFIHYISLYRLYRQKEYFLLI
jgi:hypothetical protein